MGFVVRPATASDAKRIAELHVTTWREAFSHLLPDDFFGSEHSRKRQGMWNHILDNPRDEWTVRVAEVGGRAVGFAMSGPSFGSDNQDPPRERQLYTIYVTEREHGTGIGQALLDDVVGTDPAMLWVAKQSPRAIAFYRRNGFELDGTEQIDPDAPGITAARMVRQRGRAEYGGIDRDSNGDRLDGAKTYRLHLSADAPAKDFWSIVVYDPQTRSELQTGQPYPSKNNAKPGLASNPDGSVDLRFGPEPPTGDDADWIQTVPGKGWFALLRLYGPLEPWFDKTWRPGEIEPTHADA